MKNKDDDFLDEFMSGYDDYDYKINFRLSDNRRHTAILLQGFERYIHKVPDYHLNTTPSITTASFQLNSDLSEYDFNVFYDRRVMIDPKTIQALGEKNIEIIEKELTLCEARFIGESYNDPTPVLAADTGGDVNKKDTNIFSENLTCPIPMINNNNQYNIIIIKGFKMLPSDCEEFNYQFLTPYGEWQNEYSDVWEVLDYRGISYVEKMINKGLQVNLAFDFKNHLEKLAMKHSD